MNVLIHLISFYQLFIIRHMRQHTQLDLRSYAETMFGRRRPVPELTSGNFMQRSFGERVAMNSPIQGTAADIIKLAMIHVWIRPPLFWKYSDPGSTRKN